MVHVVDDQQKSVLAYIDALELEGCEVIVCPSAEEAIVLFDRMKSDAYVECDLLVLDIGMPPPKDESLLRRLGGTRRMRVLYEDLGAHLLRDFRDWNRVTQVCLLSQYLDGEHTKLVWEMYNQFSCRDGVGSVPWDMPDDAEVILAQDFRVHFIRKGAGADHEESLREFGTAVRRLKTLAWDAFNQCRRNR